MKPKFSNSPAVIQTIAISIHSITSNIPKILIMGLPQTEYFAASLKFLLSFLYEFMKTYSKEEYELLFPKLDQIEIDSELYGYELKACYY